MKKNTLNSLLFACFIIILIVASSCKLRKTTSTGIRLKNYPADVLLDSVLKGNIQYTYLKNKANAELFYQEENKQIKINIRVKKDSIIWVNLSKSSVQILTCLISKDSVKFLKKIGGKQYFLGSYEDVEKILGIQLNYMLVQDFINGNAIMLDSDEKYVSEINEDSYLLSSHKSKKIAKILQSNKTSEDRFLYRCWIDPVNFKCKKIAINLLDIENTIIAEYNDWKKIKDNLIPMNSSITYINKLDTISVKLNYNTNIKLNNKLTFPFKVTNSYTPFNIDLND